MKRLALALFTACCLASSAEQSALKPGEFVFSVDDGMYRLEAHEAGVNDVLKGISEKAGIPVCLDPDEKTTITANTRQKSIEKLMDSLSQSHAIVYVKDPATRQYRIERIVSTRQQSVCEMEEDELERTRVMQAILNAARGVRTYSMNMRSSGLMAGQQGDMTGTVLALGDKMWASMSIVMTNRTKQMTMFSDGKKFIVYSPDEAYASSIDIEQVREEMGDEFARRLASKNYDPFEGLKEDSIQYMGLESLDGQSMYVLSGEVEGAAELRKRLSSTEGCERLAKTVADSVPMTADASETEKEATATEIAEAMQAADIGQHIPATTTIWISPTDGLPRKTVSCNEAGQEMTTMEMTDVVLNPAVDERKFTYQLPPDVVVMDQTKMIIEMQKMMKSDSP
ncbi:MAG: hypothetical protein V1929_11280 [bacterium]